LLNTYSNYSLVFLFPCHTKIFPVEVQAKNIPISYIFEIQILEIYDSNEHNFWVLTLIGLNESIEITKIWPIESPINIHCPFNENVKAVILLSLTLILPKLFFYFILKNLIFPSINPPTHNFYFGWNAIQFHNKLGN